MPEAVAIAQTGLAGISCFFTIIVLGVTTGELAYNVGDTTLCLLGRFGNRFDTRGCDAATAISAIVLVISLIYTVIHTVEMIQPDTLAVIGTRVPLLIRGNLALFVAFLWTVCFGIVVNEFNDGSYAQNNFASSRSGAQAVAAFSFFGIPAWLCLGVIIIFLRGGGVRGSGEVTAPPA